MPCSLSLWRGRNKTKRTETGCHLTEICGLCKKKCWHKSVYGDNVLYVQAKTATREEDRETDNQGQESSGDDYLGHFSDSSSSYFLNHLSPVACEGSDASGKEEEEILAA